MDTWTLFALVVLVLSAIQYYVYFWSRPARETSRFLPGPRSWPIFGMTLSIGRNPVDFYKSLFDWANEHGYVYRAWAGPYLFVLVADPVFMEPFLNSTVNIKKSMNYEFLQPWLGTGLLTSFGSKWKSRRKIITPAFHFKILEGFMDSFNSNANVLISKWKQQVGGPEFDIFKHLTLYTLDVICDAAMGVQMNVQNNQNCEYLATLQKLAATIVTRSISPWYFPEFIFNMSPIGRKQNYLNKKLHSMSYKVIEERKKELSDKKKKDPGAENENDVGQKKRLAFLDMLLQYNEDGGNLTLEDIREEVDTFMFEGHDTTSSGLSFCLWSLAEHPDCQVTVLFPFLINTRRNQKEKAYEELFEIFGDTEREPTTEDLTKMKYLECVIKESLRLYPSVPIFLRELNEDVKIEGINIVAGTTVLLAPAIMHKNPKYFPNPEKFDPERFTAENVRGRHPYAYVPFSAGPRNCIGQKFAMMEIKALVSKVLRNYKLIGVGRKPTFSYEMILKTSEGLHMKLENRK